MYMRSSTINYIAFPFPCIIVKHTFYVDTYAYKHSQLKTPKKSDLISDGTDTDRTYT